MKGPLENIVVSGVYAVAPTRYSLFSPLSPSLHLALRALGLQAHSLRRLRREGRDGAKHTEAKRKTNPIGLVFFLVAEVGFEPHDLRVMSPTSYQAALLRDILNNRGFRSTMVPVTGIEQVRYIRITGF